VRLVTHGLHTPVDAEPVLVTGRQLEQVEVGERDPQVLRLPTPIRTHVHVAVGRTIDALGGIDPGAERRPAGEAVAAGAAADVERYRHAIADLDLLDTGADLLDDAHVLVAENLPFLDVGAALVHVQVGAADVGGGDAHDHVGGCLDGCVGHLLHSHVERSLVDDSLRGDPLRRMCRPMVGP